MLGIAIRRIRGSIEPCHGIDARIEEDQGCLPQPFREADLNCAEELVAFGEPRFFGLLVVNFSPVLLHQPSTDVTLSRAKPHAEVYSVWHRTWCRSAPLCRIVRYATQSRLIRERVVRQWEFTFAEVVERA